MSATADGDVGSYQEAVDILWAAHQHGEVAQLLSQGQQDLIFIVDGV